MNLEYNSVRFILLVQLKQARNAEVSRRRQNKKKTHKNNGGQSQSFKNNNNNNNNNKIIIIINEKREIWSTLPWGANENFLAHKSEAKTLTETI